MASAGPSELERAAANNKPRDDTDGAKMFANLPSEGSTAAKAAAKARAEVYPSEASVGQASAGQASSGLASFAKGSARGTSQRSSSKGSHKSTPPGSTRRPSISSSISLSIASVRSAWKDPPKVTARATTANFITGGLGCAMFSLPWSMAGSSIITSVVIIAAVLLVNAWTIWILVRAAERYQKFDLGSILRRLPRGLGRPLEAIFNIFVWLAQFLCVVSYIIVMHDSAEALVSGTWLHDRVLLVGLASAIVLPFNFLSLRLLARTSSFAILVNVYLFILVGVLYGQGIANDELPEGSCVFGSTWRGNFAMITVAIQAITVQMCVLPMYRDLEDRTPEKFDKIVAVSFTALFFLFSGFSTVAYLLVGPGVQSNILQDLPDGPAFAVAQVGIIFMVACVYPIMIIPMIAPLEEGEAPIFGVLDRCWSVFAAKFLIVAGTMVTAVFVPTVGLATVITGALSSLIFIVLVPSVVGLVLLDVSKLHKAALWLLILVGGAVSLVGFVFIDNYVDDLTCIVEG